MVSLHVYREPKKKIARMMCYLAEFLNFTGEEACMFQNKRLPTLDTEMWVVRNEEIRYHFYEKPTLGNRVLLKNL